MEYPLIPIFAAQGATESRDAYGMRALQYALDHGAYLLLALEALEAAYAVTTIAIRSREMSDTVRERIQVTRTAIGVLIRKRATDRADAESFAAFVASVPRTQGGAKVPTVPRAPRSPSPAGVMPLHAPDVANPF